MTTSRRTFLSMLAVAAVGSTGCVRISDGSETEEFPDRSRLRWRYQTGGRVRASPSLNDDSLYSGSADHHLRAFDPDSGTLLWAFETDDEILSNPVVNEGTIYVGSNDSYLYAVDIDGDETWRFETNNWVTSEPAVVGDSILFGSYDGYVYAIER